jgi:hypothetical protein
MSAPYAAETLAVAGLAVAGLARCGFYPEDAKPLVGTGTDGPLYAYDEDPEDVEE